MSEISLSACNVTFLSIDLISVAWDLSLIVVIQSGFLIKHKSEIINLLFQAHDTDGIALMLSSVIVVLK